jgi:undecaprenyl-diphosphatase
MVNQVRTCEADAAGVAPLVLSNRTALGVVIAAILSWSAALLLWRQAALDKWVLLSHEGLRAQQLAASMGHMATKFGMSAIVLVYLVYLLFAIKLARLRGAYRIYLLVILMFGIAGPAGDILKEVVKRPRPFVEYSGEIHALSRPKSPSLPSGHATKSVALALPFLLFVTVRDGWHKAVKALLAALALGVCYFRVMLGAHYLSDVLAGVGVALVCVPLATLLTNKLLGRMNNRILSRAVLVWAAILAGIMVVTTVI